MHIINTWLLLTNTGDSKQRICISKYPQLACLKTREDESGEGNYSRQSPGDAPVRIKINKTLQKINQGTGLLLNKEGVIILASLFL